METKCILVEVTEGIGVLKINRPESLNALNGEVLEEMESALVGLERDTAVKVVVVTGAGNKAFVAGGDIKEMLAMDPLAGQAFGRKGQRVMLLIGKMKKTVIAAVNGYALGGGLELALACDFIYASDKAKLGLPEVTLGVIPGFGGTQNLARLIGPNKAKELIFSGKILSAQQAKEWGIVNEVFTAEELSARVMEIAQLIARNGMIAVATAKDAIVNGLNMNKEDGLRYESSLFSMLFATEDQKEGMQAFIAKRKPEFKNK
ncbi:MAG: enoyl-CoA hydratase/isomerase family protein [Candidatus Atribacteria bacterium]|nr:enoyl-CoA hydratase/isomerase family protein [Candidatus Atribacteria bacterium]